MDRRGFVSRLTKTAAALTFSERLAAQAAAEDAAAAEAFAARVAAPVAAPVFSRDVGSLSTSTSLLYDADRWASRYGRRSTTAFTDYR